LTNCFEQLQHVLEGIPNEVASSLKGKLKTTKEDKDWSSKIPGD